MTNFLAELRRRNIFRVAAAYLRTQREWAIIHADLMAGLREQTSALLADIEAELEETP